MPYPSRPRVQFGTDLTPYPIPARTPTPTSPRILIIGAGVAGLTTAWLLLDRGYHVTVLADAYPSWGKQQRLTSQIAGALWELPPGGCGPQATEGDLDTARELTLEAYTVFADMMKFPGLAEAFGLKMRRLGVFATKKFADDKAKREKMEMIARSDVITGFRHDPEALMREMEVNWDFQGEIKDAYEHTSPVIDSDKGMAWLLHLVRCKGAKLVKRKIEGDLITQERELLREYSADVIVNCTGLGARETASDGEVYPVRGAVLRIVNDGTHFPQITSAAVFSTDSDENGKFKDVVFMVPRNDNTMILGSIVEENEMELNLTPDTQVVKDVLERGGRFISHLKKAKLVEEYPLAQGLRPFRKSNLRVERDQRRKDSSIVHCYGHGGAGWSLSFGSAAEAASVVDEVLGNRAQKTSKHKPDIRARI